MENAGPHNIWSIRTFCHPCSRERRVAPKPEIVKNEVLVSRCYNEREWATVYIASMTRRISCPNIRRKSACAVFLKDSRTIGYYEKRWAKGQVRAAFLLDACEALIDATGRQSNLNPSFYINAHVRAVKSGPSTMRKFDCTQVSSRMTIM